MRWEREHNTNINHNLLVESNRIIMTSINGYLLSLLCRQYNFLYVFRQVVDCWSKYPQPSEKLSCPKAANNAANESRKAKAANSSILLHLVRELKKLFAQALAFLNRTWSFFIFHWFKHICRLQLTYLQTSISILISCKSNELMRIFVLFEYSMIIKITSINFCIECANCSLHLSLYNCEDLMHDTHFVLFKM